MTHENDPMGLVLWMMYGSMSISIYRIYRYRFWSLFKNQKKSVKGITVF